MKDLLIVEDDPTLGEGIRLALQAPELRPQLCRSLADAGDLLSRRSFDLLILDINLPDGNGLDLLRALRRESEVPVILLTANDLETDIVAGLELGADDYLTKPFNPLEIIARVKANLRRFYQLNPVSPVPSGSNVLSLGPLRLDLDAMSLTKNGAPIALTPTEYKILCCLMRSPGRIFTKVQLYEAVSGAYFESDENTMMVHISKLRDKIEDDPRHPCFIKTVRGLGYKIEAVETY